ncbi:theoredoxin domain containing protein [Babesia ovis]|uniref:Theoredoxin domain containing protein n=1 Tax=Babesia ovis TaxID=5869 RepID=A0A9W5WW20_BABOV|nr:theoredoxin domain containing protein [Babesia ovis]
MDPTVLMDDSATNQAQPSEVHDQTDDLAQPSELNNQPQEGNGTQPAEARDNEPEGAQSSELNNQDDSQANELQNVIAAVSEYVPETDQIAEVILVTTSLGGMKRQFFHSRLVQHLLDCKGIVYYLVDANRDFTRAAALKDHFLYEKWCSEGILKTEKIGDRSSVILPQLLVDGVSVGSAREIQDLEDDGDLDYIIARMVCPNCLEEKSQDALQCAHCNVSYQMHVPTDYVDGVDIQRICQGINIGIGENQ